MVKLHKKIIPDPNTIAVFRALKFGDMLCSIPALRTLRKAYPHASITLIGLPWAKEFAERFPMYIDEFLQFPGYPGLPEQQVNSFDVIAFLLTMNREQFDFVLQMQGNGIIVNSLISLFDAKVTAGYFPVGEQHLCPDTQTYFPYPVQEHEIKRWVRLMELLGMKSTGFDLEFPISRQEYNSFFQMKQKTGISKKYICIHPGVFAAQLNKQKKIAVIADALNTLDFQIILTGTENEKTITRGVQKYMRSKAIDLTGRTNLGVLGALVENSDLLITNDTGISQIAAALQVPSIILFTPADPLSRAPLDNLIHKTITKNNSNTENIIQAAKQLIKSNNKKRRVKSEESPHIAFA